MELGQPFKNYQQGLEFIQQIQTKIQEMTINSSSKNIQEILFKITSRIQIDHLSLIITLHSKNLLQKLLQACYAQYQKNKNKGYEKNIQILYHSYKSFFKFEPKYATIIKKFNIKAKQLDEKKNKETEDLLKQLYRLKNADKTSYGTGKQINSFITRYLIAPITTTPFQEIMYTWVRKQVESLQSEVWKQKQKVHLICCYLHFSSGNKQQFSQNIYQSALVDNKSKQLDQSFQKENKDAIRRSIVSFLNSKGGILYLGFKFDQASKTIEINGYPLSNDEKIKFLEFMLKQIAIKIYPCDDERIQETVENQNIRLVKYTDKTMEDFNNFIKTNPQKKEFFLTKYISVQFVNIYNPNTLVYERKSNRLYYIIKINVKAGDPYEIYHYINEKQVPEAYFREGVSVNKKTIFQYYDMLYDLLRKKANKEQLKKQTKEAHIHCRNILVREKTEEEAAKEK